MVKKIIIGAIFLLVLGVASAWTYKLGLSVSQSFEAIKFIVMVQDQHKCIENSDIECVSKLNELMAHVTAAQLKRTDISGLSETDQKGIDEFLEWESKLGPEKK